MNPSFDPNALQIDGDTVTLRGSECGACATVVFPIRPTCLRCGGHTRARSLPTIGVVRTHCGMSIPLPGAAAPNTIVRVELCPGLIVQGVMAGEVQIGDRVVLTPTHIEAGQDAYTGFGFTRSGHAR